MFGVSARVGFTSFFHKTNKVFLCVFADKIRKFVVVPSFVVILLAPRSISPERLNESEF
jgi:hypothetical protein